jgi:putative flippase GtrA
MKDTPQGTAVAVHKDADTRVIASPAVPPKADGHQVDGHDGYQVNGHAAAADGRVATVEVVVPVYNEERALPGCLRTLHTRLSGEFPFGWRITVVDNASTDRTVAVAGELAAELPGVRVVHLDRKGKGVALRTAWGASDADIVAYMDVDLSTGLDGFLPLIAPLVSGHSDVAIGSRLAPGARTLRGMRRELISRGYNRLIRLTHGVRFSDGQCGFKAGRSAVIRPLLEATRDDGFFFDTELLLLADHNGLRIHEVAVDWVEDVDSRVDVGRTALKNIAGLWRMARVKAAGHAHVELPARPGLAAEHPDAVLAAKRRRGVITWELGCFLAIGVISTAGHALLYWLLRWWWAPLLANLVAQSVVTLANTEANRRLTWRDSRTGLVRAHLGAAALFVVGYLMTVGSVYGFRQVVDHTSAFSEAVVLAVACVCVTALRFVVLRSAVFARRAGRRRGRV